VAGAVKKPATPKSNKLPVTCPHCGHKQLEPPAAYSTVCKGCGQHFRVQDASKPAVKAAPTRKGGRHVTCFKCNTELDVSPTAQSTMCKRCSSHMDLRDYTITNATSRNFETKGRFVVEEGAYLFNTDTTATHLIIKGRVLGKLTAEDSLEIYSTAELKGSFKARKLVVPAGQRFRWAEPLKLHGAEIAGELVANIKGGHTIVLKSTARLFGNVESENIVIEPGAVIVGDLKIVTNHKESAPVRPSMSNVPVS
jgi:cytoskeletal protein CcmA (bactofilin family)/ribosomal protein S27E